MGDVWENIIHASSTVQDFFHHVETHKAVPLEVPSIASRWREIRACNDNACGESKSQNYHDSLLDLTFLIAATDPKAPIY